LVGAYGKTLAWDQAFTSHAGDPATGGAFAIEPHTAERLFDQLAREAQVPVHFAARLASVRKHVARISELVTENGAVFRARMFIDASYEGDLVANEIRRIVKEGVVTREGKTATGRGGAPPYPIGCGAIVPRAGQCENLFVTFALSASHTAFSSIRMEPVYGASGPSANHCATA
jgi:hypothetical protein